MKTTDVLAIDLGAGSGRAIIGSFDGEIIELREVHRFYHKAVSLGDYHVWDFQGIYDNVKTSIRNAVQNYEADIISIGVDSWAQDYGLLDAQDNLLGHVHTYRDARSAGMQEKLLEKFSENQLYNLTGLTPHPICTLMHLMSMAENQKTEISGAKTLLFVADLINFYLTDEKRCNTSVAAMSLLYNPFKKSWCSEIIDKMNIPDILPRLISPGETLGRLSDSMSEELGGGNIDVCAVTSHDTLSAFDFIPNQKDKVVISSGTWSVLGCKTTIPIVTDEAFHRGFINEPGYGNNNFLLRNITGMWIAQEVIREWKQEENFEADFGAMAIAAQKSSYMGCIDVDEPQFALPGNMQDKIYDYLDKTGQSRPVGKTEMFRAILISLAFKYKQSISQLQDVLKKEFTAIHIVGGGAKNAALNQIAADICGVPVMAGPHEATAIGNILCQLLSSGEIGDCGQAEKIVERSCKIEVYHPKVQNALQGLYERIIL